MRALYRVGNLERSDARDVSQAQCHRGGQRQIGLAVIGQPNAGPNESRTGASSEPSARKPEAQSQDKYFPRGLARITRFRRVVVIVASMAYR